MDKFSPLPKMDTFLQKHNLPKQTKEKLKKKNSK